jgi:hypothetical protein
MRNPKKPARALPTGFKNESTFERNYLPDYDPGYTGFLKLSMFDNASTEPLPGLRQKVARRG